MNPSGGQKRAHNNGGYGAIGIGSFGESKRRRAVLPAQAPHSGEYQSLKHLDTTQDVIHAEGQSLFAVSNGSLFDGLQSNHIEGYLTTTLDTTAYQPNSGAIGPGGFFYGIEQAENSISPHSPFSYNHSTAAISEAISWNPPVQPVAWTQQTALSGPQTQAMLDRTYIDDDGFMHSLSLQYDIAALGGPGSANIYHNIRLAPSATVSGAHLSTAGSVYHDAPTSPLGQTSMPLGPMPGESETFASSHHLQPAELHGNFQNLQAQVSNVDFGGSYQAFPQSQDPENEGLINFQDWVDLSPPPDVNVDLRFNSDVFDQQPQVRNFVDQQPAQLPARLLASATSPQEQGRHFQSDNGNELSGSSPESVNLGNPRDTDGSYFRSGKSQSPHFGSVTGSPVTNPDNHNAPADNLDLLSQMRTTPGQEIVGGSYEDFVFVLVAGPDTIDGRLPRQKRGSNGGRRLGRLSDSSREDAAELRNSIGACWNCGIRKVKCSTEIVCSKCQEFAEKIPGSVCDRTDISAFTGLFFPEPASGHFQDEAVTKLMALRVRSFTTNTFTILLTCGPTHPPMRLQVTEFVPCDDDYSKLRELSRDSAVPGFRTTNSVAIGLDLSKTTEEALELLCRSNIEHTGKRPRPKSEADSGDTSPIVWKVYNVIHEFAKKVPQNDLLREAISLYNMQYFMKKALRYTNEFGESITNSLQRPHRFDYGSTNTSRMLTRQIKQRMQRELRRRLGDVLSRLQSSLKKQHRKNWAEELCTILLLCMVAEMVQVAIDVRVFSRLDAKDQRPQRDSFRDCKRLEENVFGKTMTIYHGVNKSLVKYSTRFNPLADGHKGLNERKGMTPAACQVVDELRAVVEEHRTQMQWHARTELELSSHPSHFATHVAFRKENFGRLVSKCLLSFYDQPA